MILLDQIIFLPHNTHCEVLEENMAPLILNIEEDKEDTANHGNNDEDNDKQPTVKPDTGPQIAKTSFTHCVFNIYVV